MTPKIFSKILIILTVTIVLSGLAVGIFFWSALTEASKKVKEKELTLDSFTEKEMSLDNLGRSYEKIKKNNNIVHAALPDQKDATALMTSLSNLAAEKGVEIVVYDLRMNAKKTPATASPTTENKEGSSTKTDTPAPPINLSLSQTEKEGDLYRLPLSITASGSYVKVLEYLKKLEHFDRLLVIDKISIIKSNDMSADTVKAAISVGAYLKP